MPRRKTVSVFYLTFLLIAIPFVLHFFLDKSTSATSIHLAGVITAFLFDLKTSTYTYIYSLFFFETVFQSISSFIILIVTAALISYRYLITSYIKSAVIRWFFIIQIAFALLVGPLITKFVFSFMLAFMGVPPGPYAGQLTGHALPMMFAATSAIFLIYYILLKIFLRVNGDTAPLSGAIPQKRF